MLTIDLLRSMIHNLVTGQRGSCSHRAGTVALAHGANIAEHKSHGTFRGIYYYFYPFIYLFIGRGVPVICF